MFNQRELKVIEKAYEELEQVQANCSARLLCREDIEDCIKEAKKAFNKLDPIERKYLIKLVATCDYSVPVAYNWSAKTSRIDAELNHHGTLASIRISRDDARIEGHGGGKDISIKCKYE